MAAPLTQSAYNANPLQFDPKTISTKDNADSKKLKEKEDSKGFSFKEFTNKFASKVGAPGMHSSVAETGAKQLEFAQKLLLKQLQCQTPDNSFDPNQMMESMMGMLNIAQNSELVNMQKENMELQKALFYTSLSSFKGEMVEHSGNVFDYQNEEQEIVFNMPAKVDKAVLTIIDENNQLVKTIELEKKTGRNSFKWDGKKDDGTEAGKGIYTAFVLARDENDASLDIDVRLKSQITDIAYDQNELALPMSGRIPIYDIKRRTIINKATDRYRELSAQPIRHYQDASTHTSVGTNDSVSRSTGFTLSDMNDAIPFFGT
jgi:flagellar hook assembly protein FlgD